jgi:hypothetical protein
MKALLSAYFTTLAALFGIDFVWLSLASEKLYRPILKDILVDGFRPARRSPSISSTRRAWSISRCAQASPRSRGVGPC